jgi:hypothetical protein
MSTAIPSRGGRLGDLFGRKWTFIGGLLGFAVASAIGGAAGSFGVLVAARATQGLFGAVLAPSALALLSTTFTDPSERGKAFGIFGAIAGGGASVGLLLGGGLTEWLSWRWCLFVNLLFAIPAALAAFRLLVNQRRPRRPPLDLPGIATASLGLFALVYGFSNSGRQSWGDPVTVVMLATSVMLLALFVAIEARAARRLLPLRVLGDRTRAGSYLAIGLAGLAWFAVFLFLTYNLQRTKGLSPIETGLAFLPLTAAVVLGAGIGNIFAPAIASATFGVTPQDSGVASAMVSTMQQIGGSVGTALLSSIFAGAVSAYAHGKPPSPQLASAATVHGYTVAFWVAGGTFALGAVVVGAIMRSVRLVPGSASEPAARPIAA